MRASKAHCSLGTRVHRAIRTLGALFMLAAVELASPAKTFAAQDVASVLERVVAYDFWGWNICGEGPDRASAYCCGITQTWTYLSNREDPQGYPPIIWFLYDIEWNENGVISHSQVEKPAEEKWTCPTSDYTFDESSRTCQPKAGMHVTKNRGAPQQPGVSAMPTFCPPQPGNPINVGIGTKFQIETDYESAGPAPLVFMRYYNSGTAGVQQTTIGAQWRTTFDRSISLTEGPTLTTASAYRPEGNIYHFNSSAGSWTSDPDVLDRLERLEDGQGNPTGWQYTTAEGLIETYDVAGKLLSMADRRGFTWSLAYGQGRLETVVGPFGRSLAFEYDASGLLSRMTAPGGQIYQYGHDSNGDLVSVTYPDLHSKTYLYSEPAHSQSGRLHDLTGVVDENGDRYATYGYASNGGAAILSEHAGGAGRTTVSYSATPLRPHREVPARPFGVVRLRRHPRRNARHRRQRRPNPVLLGRRSGELRRKRIPGSECRLQRRRHELRLLGSRHRDVANGGRGNAERQGGDHGLAPQLQPADGDPRAGAEHAARASGMERD